MRKNEKKNLLMSIQTDISIRCSDGSDCNGSPKVCQRIDIPSSPRNWQTINLRRERDEEDYQRLIQTIKHVHPELGTRVLQTADTTDVELRECKSRFCIYVLVEGYVARVISTFEILKQ